MKKIAILALYILFSASVEAQCNPDVNCSSFAELGTFKVLNNPGEIGADIENVQGNNSAVMTCELLCAIEQNRREHNDVKIWIDGLWVLIYAQETLNHSHIE